MKLKLTKRELAAGIAVFVPMLAVPLVAGWMLAFGGSDGADNAWTAICAVSVGLLALWFFLMRKELPVLPVYLSRYWILFLLMGGAILSLLAKVGFEAIAQGRIAYGALALATLPVSVVFAWGFTFAGTLYDKECARKEMERRSRDEE